MIYLTLIILFISSALLTYGYWRYALHRQWLDVPNTRSSHTIATPRGGGLIFVVLWIITCLVALWMQVWTLHAAVALIPGVLLIAVIAYADDHYTIRARWRALLYAVAAVVSVMVLGGFPQLIIAAHTTIPLAGFGWIFAILAIVWSVNLFNFMDGLDGIAAVEALFTLGVGGWFLYHAQAQGIATIAWFLAVSVAGFLVWNKPPAKIFMGDVGSATLGFVIITLALLGERWYGVPLLLWVMLYAVFLVDTTLTLLRRLWEGEPIYQAHRLHAYQRLHQAGLGHGKVLLWVIGVNSVLAGLAVTAFYCPGWLPWLAIVAGIVVLIGYGWVEKLRPMYGNNPR